VLESPVAVQGVVIEAGDETGAADKESTEDMKGLIAKLRELEEEKRMLKMRQRRLEADIEAVRRTMQLVSSR
jgi:hypothetical protein